MNTVVIIITLNFEVDGDEASAEPLVESQYQAADEDCFMDENIDDVSSANVKNVDLNDPDFAASDLESDGGNPSKLIAHLYNVSFCTISNLFRFDNLS